MEQLHSMVVWRFAGMRPGVLYVMDSGLDLMHKWLADNWDTQLVVCMKVYMKVYIYESIES